MTKDFAQGLLSKLMAVGEATVALLSTEIPATVMELLRWKLAINCIQTFVWTVALIALIMAVRKIWKSAEDWSNQDRSFAKGISGGIGLMVGIVIFIEGVMNYGLEAIKIWLAPRVFLIEYLKNFIDAQT